LFENNVIFSQFLSSTVFTVQTIMPVNAWNAKSFILNELSGWGVLWKCMENQTKCMKSHLWAELGLRDPIKKAIKRSP
jgi:hypothetical protein